MDTTSTSYLEQYLSSLSPQQRKQYHTFGSYYFCADEENANRCADLETTSVEIRTFDEVDAEFAFEEGGRKYMRR